MERLSIRTVHFLDYENKQRASEILILKNPSVSKSTNELYSKTSTPDHFLYHYLRPLCGNINTTHFALPQISL